MWLLFFLLYLQEYTASLTLFNQVNYYYPWSGLSCYKLSITTVQLFASNNVIFFLQQQDFYPIINRNYEII